MEKDKKKPNKADKEFVKNTVDINPKLNEAAGKTAVIAWGRMNPITIGHEKLVNKVKELARKNKADPKIFLSHSHDAKKNPLSYEDKIELARNAFGNIIYKSTAKTIIEVLKQLQGQYSSIVLVAGQDRIPEFESLLNKYNGKEYNFNSISVVSAGERDPDADDVTGMSASKLRSLASSGNFEAFKKGLPYKLQAHAKDVYTLVRGGLKLAEAVELDETVLNFVQRQARARTMKRYKTRIQFARERLKRRMATSEKLMARARKAAIKAIRKRIAGARGAEYGSLSVSEKIQIDKLVEKRKKAIGKIAKRLLPSVRRAEMIRLRQVLQGHTQDKVNESFSAFLDEKRFHELYHKNKSVKFDRRFKFNRHVAEMFDNDKDLLNLIEEMHSTMQHLEEKDIKALHDKAKESGIPYGTLKKVFDRGMGAWEQSHRPGTTPQQWAFARVNSFIAGGKTSKTADKDLASESHIHPHVLDPNVPLKHQISKKHTKVDADIDGDTDRFDKTIPADISGMEKNIYKKVMAKYAGEKQQAKKHVAYESVNEAFSNFLQEGVNDPSIFKAVFLAGGPGSGKSFIVGKTALTALGFKVINSDDAFERALAKVGLKPTPEDIYSPKGQEVRGQAKALTSKKMQLALDGRLGLVIDGTGKDYEKIEKQAKKLRDLGYEVAMIFVNTDLDTAKDRNRARARSLPDAEVEAMWNAVQKNIGKFQNFFRQKMFIIDNSDGANFEGAVLSTYRKLSAWAKTKPEAPSAKAWIKSKTIKEAVAPREKMISSALAAIDRRVKSKGDKESLGGSAFEIAKAYNLGISGRELEALYKKHMKEEHGAGEWGTKKLTKKYKKDTPCECGCDSVNEAFEAMFEESQCDLVTMKQMKDFERFVDRMFDKYNIDFEFTKHFGDRMGDERNTPCIKMKELADLITKIYKKHGNPLKGKEGAEVVVKDIQSDLNIPFVIDYNPKNDEFKFTAKTIMRKKNFATPNEIIKY